MTNVLAASAIFIDSRTRIDEVAHWFAGCAMHPQADTDKSLTPYLRQYNLVQGIIDDNSSAPTDVATYAADPSFCGSFPQMKDALERICKATDEPAYLDALEAFVQLGANVVDTFLFVDRYTESHGPIDGIFLEGLGCVTWAWDNLLDNPCGNMSHDLRVFLTEEVHREPLVTQMLCHLLVKVRMNNIEKTKHKLHSVMWTSILRYAADLPGKPRDKLDAVIQNAPNLEGDQKKHILAALAGELPEVDRPIRTTDEVTAELLAHAARIYNDNDNEPQDVPIKALGPEIDPRTLGHPSTEAPSADEQCAICRGEFTGTEEPFLALDACNHLFHVDCFDPWVNRVELGLSTIQCPYCRAPLCDARNYRGVLKE